MYKHFLSISSQIAFCSAPLRLDTFNACQFSCGYCYARARTGSGRDAKLAAANALTLENRLLRIERGIVKSALDEFIERRTPIQFGGMSDPFMPMEAKTNATLSIMRVLKEFDYPYLLSTKGALVFQDAYVKSLRQANVIVRFSFAGCSDRLRHQIDRGVLNYATFLSHVGKLRDNEIKVGLRLQPLIPGQEVHAADMLLQLPEGAVDHVSAEFLKVPVSADRKFGAALLEHFGGSVISWYRRNGAALVGNEYVLSPQYRRNHLSRLREICTSKSITFGYADNDLLLLSDGNGCCSGADLYLHTTNIFQGNTLGIIRRNILNGEDPATFNVSDIWIPNNNIAQYLNSKSRLFKNDELLRNWMDYIKESWEGNWGQYDHDYFLNALRVVT